MSNNFTKTVEEQMNYKNLSFAQFCSGMNFTFREGLDFLNGYVSCTEKDAENLEKMGMYTKDFWLKLEKNSEKL